MNMATLRSRRRVAGHAHVDAGTPSGKLNRRQRSAINGKALPRHIGSGIR